MSNSQLGGVSKMIVELRRLSCGNCGGVYALTDSYVERKQEAGGFWCCPYCQTRWGYSDEETELERVRRERDRAQQQVAQERDQTATQRKRAEHFKRSRDATRGHLTKTKNRIHKGACIHCNRYFDNLAKHMSSKHPKTVIAEEKEAQAQRKNNPRGSDS